MDHLLLPLNALVGENEKAPYIADPYDGGDFLSFPQRSRFRALYEEIKPEGHYASSRKDLDVGSTRDLEVFIQTWVVFGLLYEVFAPLLTVEAFIKAGEDDDEKQLLEHLIECIMAAHSFLMAARKRAEMTESVLCSAASIGETLEFVVMETLDRGTRSLSTTWEFCLDRVSIAAIMQNNGWCPTDLRKWQAIAGGFQTLYYLSKVRQPKTKDHGNCVGEVCVASQYNMDKQSLVHRCGKHDCGLIFVDEEVMQATFDDGHFGLLRFSGLETMETLSMDVVSHKDESEYIALSHVWADGLGNPNSNALPRCQMEHVAKCAEQLSWNAGYDRSLPVWLDTLCCPVSSPRHRSSCLMLMRQIYQKATLVLTLDTQIAHYDASDLDSVEICARVLFSGWTRRLWTLQEGALAGSLWIQLKDRAVDLAIIQTEIDDIYRHSFVHNQLALILLSGLRRLRNFGRRGQSRREPDLIDVRLALESRSVTIASDEALCLCTCLALDQTNVVNAAREDRMAIFWWTAMRAGPQLPRGILFFTGPRMQTKGMRWAPASFRSHVKFQNLRRAKKIEEQATITPNGLQIQCSVCEVSICRPLTNSEEESWNTVLSDLRGIFLARLEQHQWFMLLPADGNTASNEGFGARDTLERRDSFAVLQDLDILSMQRNGVAQGLVGIVGLAQHDQPHTFSLSSRANVLCCNETMSRTLEILYSHRSDIEALDGVSDEVTDDFEIPSISPYISRLSPETAQRVTKYADVLVSSDSTLVECLVHAQTQDAQTKALGPAAEWMLYFLAGHVGTISRTWPSDQTWCVD
ncbi:hypothetical protein LTR86_009546 [Recurvomyces mirabilis]|nr:hypothetical protein LTR86_009546 [Recurvomyces mirabilis]